MKLGEAFNVQFVKHSLMPWDAERSVRAPGKGLVRHDPGERRERGGVRFRVENRRVPAEIARDQFGIGIEQDLTRVKTMTPLRRIWPVHSITVNLPRLQARNNGVPDLVGLFRQRDSL